MINWFNHLYPYSNLHELNLDWVIATVKNGEKEIADFIGVNTIKYANPILWNIESQYEANTVVVDGQTGNAYISIKAVPSGVHLNRIEYWTQIYNYANVVDTLREQIAHNEGDTTTATQQFAVGDLVFVKTLLYRVIAPMIAGDSFVENSNIVKTTIEAELKANIQAIQSEASARQSADTQLQNNIDSEASARESADTQLQNNIDAEASARQSADTTLQNNIDAEASARVSADTQLKNEIMAKLNDVMIDVRELGVVMNSPSDADSNVTIINNALSQHKYLFIPKGICYIGDTIVVPNKSGLIGVSPYDTTIQTTGDFNGVEVPVSVNDNDNVSTFVIITKLLISGTFNATTSNTSKGLYFYNYTFNVTCNRDVQHYQQYNSGYGLEFRDCIIDDIRVGAFSVGVYTDNYTAVLTIRNIMITTCQYCGFIHLCSDSIVENLFITFCYHGMFLRTENSKLTNAKIYMNGIKLNPNQVVSETSTGLNLNSTYCRYNVLTSVDVQENYENGVVISDGAHDIILNGVVVDGNNFQSGGVERAGVTFYNCYNISGDLHCTDRSATPTQSYGCAVSGTCYNFNILYTEYGNVKTINQAGWDTYNLLIHSQNKKFISPTLPSKLTANTLTTQLACCDGECINVHIRANANDSIVNGDTLVDLTSLISILPNYGVTPSHISIIAINGTTGTDILCDYDNGVITFIQGANSGDLILLDVSFRIKYWI